MSAGMNEVRGYGGGLGLLRYSDNLTRRWPGASLGIALARRTLVGAVLFTASVWSVPSHAQSISRFEGMSQAELAKLLRVKVRTAQHLALNPIVVKAVQEQNAQGLSLEVIQARDAAWSAEDLSDEQHSLPETPAGRFLRRQVERINSLDEAFATDNQGANVAVYPLTTDYWQGDEDKWIESFNQGDGRIFVGGMEFDESTQSLTVQISAPIIARGVTIGVLVVAVSEQYLKAKDQ